MSIKVYNTLTGKKEDFTPIEKGRVRMYVCGPTVYDLSHIGHARSAVAFDAIYRCLLHRGYDVTFTRNYTDIDDKIIKRANEEGVDSKELAERYIKAYDEDMDSLGVKTPTHRPRATETIAEITGLIETLVKKGFAYAVDGDVFFAVRKFKGYGRLSGKVVEELESGARVDVDERKSDPLDFALWKSARPGEPSWQSPWGPGRPGWHIECSAMSRKFLGPSMDIHGGGRDLAFPHHENEMAQSEAATGKPFARYWLHNGFVNIEREKMSKSLGNILTIRDALKRHTAESIRLFLLSSHYRSPIDYSPASLTESEAKAERFYRTLERMEKEWPDVLRKNPDEGRRAERVRPLIDAMDDDFNTAAVIGTVFREVAGANRLMDAAEAGGGPEALAGELPLILSVFTEAAEVLGVFSKSPAEYFSEKKTFARIEPEEIELLIKERDEARKQGNFKRADEIRGRLKEGGIMLEDTANGTKWST